MKKVLCFFLAFILLGNAFSIMAYATEEFSKGYINFYFVDSTYGTVDGPAKLDVVVKQDEVYIHLEQLCSWLGYEVVEEPDWIYVSCDDIGTGTPYTAVYFYKNSTQVEKFVVYTLLEYTAPYPTIEVDGEWFTSFGWTLKLLDSSIYIKDGIIEIDAPKENLLSLMLDYHRVKQWIDFDWSEIGYTEKQQRQVGTASRIINLINGVLSFDTSAYADMFLQAFGNTYVNDDRNGQALASFICNLSEDEVNAIGERYDKTGEVIQQLFKMIDVSSEFWGNVMDVSQVRLEKPFETSQFVVNNFLKNYSNMILNDEMYHQYDSTYQLIKKNYGKYYQNNKENIKSTENAGTALDLACVSLNVINDVSDNLSFDPVMKRVLHETLQKNSLGCLPNGTKNALSVYSSKPSALISAGVSATMNIMDWKFGDFAIQSIAKASMVTAGVIVAWNLFTGLLPYLADTLNFEDPFSTATLFEQATYAMILQFEASDAHDAQETELYGSQQLDRNKLENVVNTALVYLKSAYVARNLAVKMVDSSASKEFLSAEKTNNSHALNLMAKLLKNIYYDEDTKKTTYNFGFLPDESQEVASYEKKLSKKLIQEDYIKNPDKISLVEPVGEEWEELRSNLKGNCQIFLGRYSCERDDIWNYLLWFWDGSLNYRYSNAEKVSRFIEPFWVNDVESYDGSSYRYYYWEDTRMGESDPLDVLGVPKDILNNDGSIDWNRVLEHFNEGKTEIGYHKASAEFIEWIIKDVFNNTITRDIDKNRKLYYYDGYYYYPQLGGDAGFLGIEDLKITSTEEIENGKYRVIYQVKRLEKEYYTDYYYAIVSLKERSDGFRFWSFYEFGSLEE